MLELPEDYTQPFWVGFNNPRFRYARSGYLPALELPEEPPPEVTIKKIYTYINIDKKALELQKRIVSLEEKLKEKERLDKKKPSTKYIYSNIKEEIDK